MLASRIDLRFTSCYLILLRGGTAVWWLISAVSRIPKVPSTSSSFFVRRAPVHLEHPWHGGQAASFPYAPAGTRRQMAMGASGMDRFAQTEGMGCL